MFCADLKGLKSSPADSQTHTDFQYIWESSSKTCVSLCQGTVLSRDTVANLFGSVCVCLHQ